MKYMGSKLKYAKEILPFILENRTPNQWYVEPFVGGGNVIDKVEGKRIGSDVNFYLIEVLKKLSEGTDWVVQDATEEIYKKIRDNKDEFPPWLVGYYGFALSYGGKWFGGWRRDCEGRRNYVMEAYRNAIQQSPKLNGVIFHNSTYLDLQIPNNSIIYCDPPYRGVTGYGGARCNFDHDEFFNWCIKMQNSGHSVYISEYDAPSANFKCVWEKSVCSSLTSNTSAKIGVEKLFKVTPFSKKGP
jgi:DNA adenine methylase